MAQLVSPAVVEGQLLISYLWNDGPILYALRQNEGRYLLGYDFGADDASFLDILRPMTPEQKERLENGSLSLLDFLTDEPDGLTYVCHSKKTEDGTTFVEECTAAELKQKYPLSARFMKDSYLDRNVFQYFS